MAGRTSPFLSRAWLEVGHIISFYTLIGQALVNWPLLTEGRLKSIVFILGGHVTELGAMLADGEEARWWAP